MLSIPCNSWIFYTRIRAVYHDSRLVKWLFFVLWSTTLVAVSIPLTVDPTLTITSTFGGDLSPVHADVLLDIWERNGKYIKAVPKVQSVVLLVSAPILLNQSTSLLK